MTCQRWCGFQVAELGSEPRPSGPSIHTLSALQLYSVSAILLPLAPLLLNLLWNFLSSRVIWHLLYKAWYNSSMCLSPLPTPPKYLYWQQPNHVLYTMPELGTKMLEAEVLRWGFKSLRPREDGPSAEGPGSLPSGSVLPQLPAGSSLPCK